MTEEATRVRLNIGLYAAAVVCLCVAVLGAVLMHDAGRLPFQDAAASGGAEYAPRAGEDVGRGTVEAVPAASEEEQRRTAAQLRAATRMVDAFVNFSYEDPDATIDAVRSLSTGTFLEQYSKGAADLKKIARRAKSEMVADVVWSGLVAGDEDSATVIVATSGTVKNKTTKFKPEARNYRIQVELELDGGQWLTRDLQYVALG
ncbi:hypothetical protein [Nocardioides sp. SYSU DS0651]|uniref:hypothetical protein n=1 Tax=Nocardioides sp. SYSU DS0651 TaxID=3415955 RepID=UPI003F4BCC53